MRLPRGYSNIVLTEVHHSAFLIKSHSFITGTWHNLSQLWFVQLWPINMLQQYLWSFPTIKPWCHPFFADYGFLPYTSGTTAVQADHYSLSVSRKSLSLYKTFVLITRLWIFLCFLVVYLAPSRLHHYGSKPFKFKQNKESSDNIVATFPAWEWV